MLPDWRDPRSYQFPKGFPLRRWAWEFLRRNSEYRRDWDNTLHRYLNREGEYISSKGRSSLNWVGSGSPRPDQPVLYIIVNDFTKPADPEFRIPSDEATEKWKLLFGYLNPDQSEPYLLGFQLPYGDLVAGQPLTLEGGDSIVWARFDLSYPLAPQIGRIKEGLQEEQRRSGKTRRPTRHKGLWHHYLRLLDAEAQGARAKAIADHLAHEPSDADAVLDEKKLGEQLQAAHRLTKPAAYLEIVMQR